MLTSNQAGVYSQVLAYLHAVKAANTIERENVVAETRRAPIADKLFGTIVVRPDGRAIHVMHVFRVKAPAESHERWDVYTKLADIPADQAFRPLDQGGCPLIGQGATAGGR
jgi:branched-chain amino acid transport system substrate-binding protein